MRLDSSSLSTNLAIPDTFSGKFFKILNAGSETTTAQIPAAAIIYGK